MSTARPSKIIVLPKPPKKENTDTAVLAYQDDLDSTPMTAIHLPTTVKQPKLIDPISKEDAHKVWNEQDFGTKREYVLEIFKKYSYLDSKFFSNIFKKAKTVEHLNTLFTEMFFSSESISKSRNEKEMAKIDPFYIQ